MRLGGALTFNLSGAQPIALGAGGICYLPSGNYLVTPGANTLLQWWNPVPGVWQNLTGLAANNGIQVSVDGYNWRLLNNTSTVTGATIGTAGSGGTNGIGPLQTGTSIGFAAAPAGGQTAKGYLIIGGAVGTAGGACTVVQAGSGFLVPPLVLLDPPPAGGIQATAIATITAGGAINTVTIVNPGAGYVAVPNVYLVPQFLDYPGQVTPVSPSPLPSTPPGLIATMPPAMFTDKGIQLAFPVTSGALVTAPALAASGAQTGIVVVENGAGYTAAPAITFTGGTLAGTPTATATFGGAGATDTSTIQGMINE